MSIPSDFGIDHKDFQTVLEGWYEDVVLDPDFNQHMNDHFYDHHREDDEEDIEDDVLPGIELAWDIIIEMIHATWDNEPLENQLDNYILESGRILRTREMMAVRWFSSYVDYYYRKIDEPFDFHFLETYLHHSWNTLLDPRKNQADYFDINSEEGQRILEDWQNEVLNVPDFNKRYSSHLAGHFEHRRVYVPGVESCYDLIVQMVKNKWGEKSLRLERADEIHDLSDNSRRFVIRCDMRKMLFWFSNYIRYHRRRSAGFLKCSFFESGWHYAGWYELPR